MQLWIYVRVLLVFCAPLTLFAQSEKTAKARVCLNMIVKNESHVIERALASVKPIIDCWVIVDTGSSDGTQDIIRETMKEIPGELYERPWKDFGSNRTEALELARGKADYIIFLDADDILEYEETFSFPSMHADVYWAEWQSKWVPSFSYMKPLLVKDSLCCRWEGVIHEYINCEYASSQQTLCGIKYIFTSQGSRSQNPKKFHEAAQVLEDALEREPENSRYVFYLAESYRDANLPKEALIAYERRADMGGWQEEVFWSLLQVGHLKKALGYSHEAVVSSYEKAYKANPSRSEPIYYLAEMHNQKGNYERAYDCIKCWQSQPKNDQKDLLFRIGWTEDYGILFQLSIAAFYVSEYQECLDLNDELLDNPHLPEAIRNRVVLNREFPLAYLINAK